MHLVRLVCRCALLAGIFFASVLNAADEKKQTPVLNQATYQSQVAPLIKKYCVSCHSKKKPRAGVVLDRANYKSIIGKERKRWQKVLEMLEFGAMPPEDKPQPKDADVKRAVRWIEAALYYVDCEKAHDPGRVTIQRLNRSEYDNTVRDLFGIKSLQLAKDFPSDDVGSGFDNIGDVLSISPLLLEKYVDAAEKVADAVIDANATAPLEQKLSGRQLRSQGGVSPGARGMFSLHSRGAVFGQFDIPSTGDYIIRVAASAVQAGSEIARMDFGVGAKRVGSAEVKAPVASPKAYEVKTRITAGRHRISAAFVNDYYNPKAKNPADRDRNLYVASIAVIGSRKPAAALPKTHRQLIAARPEKGVTAEQAARRNLQKFLPRAFRRPVTADEVNKFAALVKVVQQRGGSFERGMQVAITGVLVSPHFLFRVERDADPNDPTKKHALTDFELASRLSYFLWSSMPDESLLALAGQNKLNDPKTLRAQVRRMLLDPKSQALVSNFAGQWLNLRILEEVTPDTKRFPKFNEQLRADMRRETELFFEYVMRQDRSVLDLINGRFSFLNQRLAGHYGIPGIQGREFRLVKLDRFPRAGVLTQGSILTLTSNPNRTSPVKRGKWIMENLLGTPPPAPPDNVPELAATAKANPGASIRKQLEVHRQSAACASCHRQMDALGFGFENYDAIGRWRDKENNRPVDASGQLPSGEKFQRPMELVQILRKRGKQFSGLITEKMLTYALGRGLEYYDRCAIEKTVAHLEKNDYRFSELVTQIVISEPFRMRRGEGKKDESP